MEHDGPADHRTRTGAQRRERMRQRLVESALAIIAQDGIGAATIDTVIKTAGVSRGSFYNYFESTDELVRAASNDLKGEMLLQVVTAVTAQPDPASRLAAGFKTFAATITAYPRLARFVQSLDLVSIGPATAVAESFPVFLRNGVTAGQFVEQPPEVMIDLITGCLVKSAARTISGGADANYLRHLVAGVLRALGLDADAAWQLSGIEAGPLELSQDGLLGRLHHLSQHQGASAQGE